MTRVSGFFCLSASIGGSLRDHLDGIGGAFVGADPATLAIAEVDGEMILRHADALWRAVQITKPATGAFLQFEHRPPGPPPRFKPGVGEAPDTFAFLGCCRGDHLGREDRALPASAVKPKFLNCH